MYKKIVFFASVIRANMTAKQKLNESTLLHDLAEAVFQVFDTVCAAVIVEGQESPAHCVGDQQVGQRLVQHPGVRSTLTDGQPRTEEPPRDGTMDDAALLVMERLSLNPDDPATVLAFATRDAADIDRALALAHALAAETASQLMLLRQSPFLAQALAEVECGVTVADATARRRPVGLCQRCLHAHDRLHTCRNPGPELPFSPG